MILNKGGRQWQTQTQVNKKGGLAYLTPESLDQLYDMIIAKLAVRNPWGLASQVRHRGFESLHPFQVGKDISSI